MLLNRYRIWGVLAALLLVGASLVHRSQGPAPVSAESHEGDPAVYHQDLALVKDLRSFDLAEGLNDVRFVDVAAQIDPTSVHFRSLTDPEGTVVLEQNYEYDIVDSAKILRKYLDMEQTVIHFAGNLKKSRVQM